MQLHVHSHCSLVSAVEGAEAALEGLDLGLALADVWVALVHVRRQVAGETRCERTVLALVWLLARVRRLVRAQVHDVREGLAARLARVRARRLVRLDEMRADLLAVAAVFAEVAGEHGVGSIRRFISRVWIEFLLMAQLVLSEREVRLDRLAAHLTAVPHFVLVVRLEVVDEQTSAGRGERTARTLETALLVLVLLLAVLPERTDRVELLLAQRNVALQRLADLLVVGVQFWLPSVVFRRRHGWNEEQHVARSDRV